MRNNTRESQLVLNAPLWNVAEDRAYSFKYRKHLTIDYVLHISLNLLIRINKTNPSISQKYIFISPSF